MRRPLPYIVFAWFCLTLGGLAALASYKARPGSVAVIPAQLPAATGVVQADSRPKLLLFAHPKCACTRATLAELEKLVPRLHGKAEVTVVIYQPESGADWSDTDVVRRAKAIPGVEVRFDRGGVEATRFGAETSGQAVLYGGDGALLFRGGITLSRGHEGDNPGSDRIAAFVNDGKAELAQSPVFGCAIKDPATGANP